MKTLSVFLIGAVLAFVCTFAYFHKRQSNHPVAAAQTATDYLCKDPAGYSPVTKKSDPNDKHCEIVWDIADPNLDAPGHPEIGILASRKDKITFNHSKGSKFTYSVAPNPADPNCDASPIDDPHAGQNASTHGPLPVVLTKGGSECHYKLSFTVTDDKGKATNIDPHIAVGN